MAKKGELNPKQKMFVAEYLIDANAHGSAIRAGYSPKTAYSIGYNLLKKVDIQKALQKAIDKRSAKAEITAAYVLNNIKQTYENLKTDNPSVALKALELLGKHLSLFSDNLNVRSIKSLEDLTDEEAVAIAKKISEASNAGG
jgi:phage terminase small subunit